jgi:hypothetical protein
MMRVGAPLIDEIKSQLLHARGIQPPEAGTLRSYVVACGRKPCRRDSGNGGVQVVSAIKVLKSSARADHLSPV